MDETKPLYSVMMFFSAALRTCTKQQFQTQNDDENTRTNKARNNINTSQINEQTIALWAMNERDTYPMHEVLVFDVIELGQTVLLQGFFHPAAKNKNVKCMVEFKTQRRQMHKIVQAEHADLSILWSDTTDSCKQAFMTQTPTNKRETIKRGGVRKLTMHYRRALQQYMRRAHSQGVETHVANYGSNPNTQTATKTQSTANSQHREHNYRELRTFACCRFASAALPI